MEYVAKLKNTAVRGDGVEARYFAGKLAELCWRLLRPLNRVMTFASESGLLDEMLGLAVAPPHYAEDMRYCLGLVEDSRPLAKVLGRSLRLASETVELLSSHAQVLNLSADLERALLEGAVLRYIAQESGWFEESNHYSLGRFFPD